MKKIVVFEDDPDIGNVLNIILSKAGYAVSLYNKVSSDCCEVVKKEDPEVILMDLNLPVIGGEKATIALKSNSCTKTIPIVILSAQADGSKTAAKLETEGFIAKPFDTNHLLLQIRHLLRSGNIK